MEKFPLMTKRLVLGHVAVCQGCCCGNTANGILAVPVEWRKKEWRARGLLKRIQLSISGCLGRCDVPNVVAISNENGTRWLGQITELNQYRTLLEWATASKDAGALLSLPDEFRDHALIRSVTLIPVSACFRFAKIELSRSFSAGLLQKRCGSKYVKPTNASHRVDVLVNPRSKPASKTSVFRAL